MPATPPFHPSSEKVEVIGRDNEAWDGDERDDPKEMASPSSHDEPHPDNLQPARENQADAEWENVGPAVMVRSELRTERRNWPCPNTGYVAITHIYKTEVVAVDTVNTLGVCTS